MSTEDTLDLLEVWEKEEDEEKEKCSDLDWIFSNGNKILHGATGASISALAACLGIKNLWGSHGEGFVYYQNAMMVLHIAKPFLEASDKIGWLAFAGKDRTSCAQGSAPNTKDAQFTDSQQPQVKTAEGSGS